jgi:cobalt-zinc-cadmium efflux system membrane fusion protein
MKKLMIITLAVSAISFGCTTEPEHNHDDGGHDHGPELEAIAYTVWTEKTELFVEFKPLVVGQTSTFAAHFSNMADFKAFEEGQVIVSLIKGEHGIRHTVEAPSSPGIFRPAVRPKEVGVYQLVFHIQTAEVTDRIVIDNVVVYQTNADAIAANPAEPEGNEISFLKEQAWKIDFAIAQAKRQNIHQVIKTAGQIEAMQGDEIMIIANTNGVVVFNGTSAQIGSEVTSKQLLFTLSGAGTTEDNIESKFAIAKAEYEKAKADYDRGQELLKEKITSQKAFDELEVKYRVAKTVYHNIVNNYSSGGKQVKAPFDGYIKDILVAEGQYVKSGESLAVITKNQKLIIKADVSQKYFAQLPSISSANFKLAYDPTIFSLEDFNGRLLSYGKNAGINAGYLPVYFEIDNKGELLSGSFVEVFLKTEPVENTVVIPWSAVMEDYENYYVYVQVSGESFEKRDVKLGINDGIQVQVLSGVSEGEWVVTTGAYQVKMASMSSTIPAHGHSH